MNFAETQKVRKLKFKQMIKYMTKNVHHEQNGERLRNNQRAFN